MNHLPENFLEHALSIDDTFQFRCNQCGECCKNREDILISPFDLFRLSRYLNMKPTEFVDRYCTTYIGQNSRLPVVIFKAVGEEQICPMLQDNHCSVHVAKPTICALYPLGRAVRVEPDGKPEVFYFLNGSICGAEDETHDFLDDASRHELHFSRGRQNCLLIKSAFDAETDFLYLLEGYYENDPHKTGDNAAYAGVYSHVRREYFDIPYVLRDRADESKSIEELLSEFSHAVSARIAEMVHDEPVPVTKEAEEIRDEREYYQKYALPREARECFFGDAKRLHYQPHYHISDPSTAEIAAMLNHFEDAVDAHAKAFIRKKAREINERLWQIGLLCEEVARMEATPGEHHARRAIMRCVAGQNMKTVNLEIQKGDESAIIKIETSALRCMDNSYYSPWRMDAPSRYKLVKRFGRNTEVFPEDVVKITYGRKVLYERNAEVSKS